MRSACQRVLIAGLVAAAVASATAKDSVPPATGLRAAAVKSQLVPPSFAALPVAFVENRGQTDAEVRYYARGDRYGFYFTDRSIVLAFVPEHTGGSALPKRNVVASLQFVGASPQARIEGTPVPGLVNYLRGSDPSGWQTGVRRFGELVYRDLWPGVNLHVREQAGVLKYEFHVAAGANAAAIKLAYTGVSSQTVEASGALALQTDLGTLRDAPPSSYQVIDGVRVSVESGYVLSAKVANADVVEPYGFSLGSYRRDRELVVDRSTC
jgi:hypothetical protein